MKHIVPNPVSKNLDVRSVFAERENVNRLESELESWRDYKGILMTSGIDERDERKKEAASLD